MGYKLPMKRNCKGESKELSIKGRDCANKDFID